MSIESNKALARRWFSSGSYKEELDRLVKKGDPDVARAKFFQGLIP